MLTQQRRRRAARAHLKSLSDAEDGQPASDGTLEPAVPQRGLWLYLSVPIASILLSGSKEPWALGLYAALVGVTLIFATPKLRLTPWISIPVFLGVALCLAAFLPAAWFPLPDWRVALERDFNLPLAATRTPQPGVTFESWLAVAVGGVWLVCCAARGFAPSERRLAIRVLVAFFGLLACAALVVRWQGVVIPFWREPLETVARGNWTYLGPFPNRNLFSEMLAAGAVLTFAATYDAFRRKQRASLLLGLAIIPLFAAVVMNTSRTGIIVFFAGIGAWMLAAGFHKRSAPRVAVAAAILLIMATMFLFLGKQIVARFSPQNLASDARLPIFSDAVKMIGRSPAFGVGLGNFEPVFAMTRPSADLYSPTRHPENDWLYLGAEAGVPCVLLGAAVLVAVLRRFWPWRSRDAAGRHDRRMRNAAGLGVLLLCVATMVDPALHAPGMFTLGCLLAGLAMRPPAPAQPEAGTRSLYLRKVLGVFCVLAGTAWFLIAAGTPVIRGNSVYRQLSSEALALAQRGDAAAALEKWNEAALIKPLEWNVYFDRALLKLQLGHHSSEALDDFGRARRLEPHSALICTREFDVWQDYDPVAGIPALGEALKRDPSRAAEFFQGRVGKARDHPELRPHFYHLAASDPKLLLVYLPVANPDEVAPLLQGLVASRPKLEMYTPEEKLRLFQLWYAKGDAADLIHRLQTNSDWRQDGWSVLAAHKAKEGDFAGAYELAKVSVPPPREGGTRPVGDITDFERTFNLRPTDILAGFDLYQAQRRESKYQEALATLDQLAKLPHYPARVLYERGITLGAKGDYALAWEALREYNARLQRERKKP